MAQAAETSGPMARQAAPKAEDSSLDSFYLKVAEASLRKYGELPKKGKPQRSQEWTPLATIVCAEGMARVDILTHRFSCEIHCSVHTFT